MDHGREDKNPWTKWFWADYESDDGLKSCGLKAQGLWMRMLSIMSRAVKRGYLLDGVNQMESKTLARLVGENESEIDLLIEELFSHGVPSKTPDGIIFNRRMAREGQLSEVRSLAGRLGGRPRKQTESKTESKAKALSASASEYASSSKRKSMRRGGVVTSPVPPAFEAFWAKYPKKLGKQDAMAEWIRITVKETPALLEEALDKYLAVIKRDGTEVRFIKHPTTFLRKDRWRDYLNYEPPAEAEPERKLTPSERIEIWEREHADKKSF